MISLYQRDDCPFCWKTRIAFAELGLDFDSIPVRLGETHDDVSTLSPAGTVPVMVDSDLILWDSRVIVEYIDAHYGSNRLHPGDERLRARVRQLHVFLDTRAGLGLREVVFERRSRSKALQDPDRIESGLKAWKECQAWLERNWLHDSEYNAADCALAARLGVAEAYGAGVCREYPGLYARFEQLKQRSSWSLAYPENFIEPR
ncbi:glutathione S-transferase family protein [Marinobacter salarius]|uniref:glutathione S-transferase family protein n=1 Tax=Marinobacter salarius TaxID=1420917 RepID=UPI0032EC7958